MGGPWKKYSEVKGFQVDRVVPWQGCGCTCVRSNWASPSCLFFAFLLRVPFVRNASLIDYFQLGFPPVVFALVIRRKAFVFFRPSKLNRNCQRPRRIVVGRKREFPVQDRVVSPAS